MSEILVSAKMAFVNLNLSRILAEAKISAEIWLRLETLCESGSFGLMKYKLVSAPNSSEKVIQSLYNILDKRA